MVGVLVLFHIYESVNRKGRDRLVGLGRIGDIVQGIGIGEVLGVGVRDKCSEEGSGVIGRRGRREPVLLFDVWDGVNAIEWSGAVAAHMSVC